MSYITADRVKETTTIVGTGTVSLLGTSTGFRTFASQMMLGDTCSYIISNASGSEWESGIATYSAANTLTRTSIKSSSNSNNRVVFTSGVKDVFIGVTADSVVDKNNARLNTINAIPVASGVGNDLTLIAGSGVGVGAGGNIVLTPGSQGSSGGKGKVLIDGLTVGGVGSISNAALGYNALKEGSNSLLSVAVGSEALAANNNGFGNSAFGASALKNNTNGSGNTAIGDRSSFSSTEGNVNTSVGAQSLYDLTTGNSNTALGAYAGNSLTTGSNNIFIGVAVNSPTASTSDFLTIGNVIFASGGFGTGTTVGVGNVGIGQNAPTAKLHVTGTSASTKVAIVQGASSQSANLQEWQNSSGNAVAYIKNDGSMWTTINPINYTYSGTLTVPPIIILGPPNPAQIGSSVSDYSGKWVSTITLSNANPFLTEITFTNVQGITGSFAQSGGPANLTSISFLALATVGSSFNPSIMAALTSLSLPALTTVGGTFGPQTMNALTSFSFPALTTIGGNFSPSTMNALTSLSAPALTTVGGTFGPSTMNALTSLSLPALTTVGGNFGPSIMAALTSLSAPALTTVGGSFNTGTMAALTSLSVPALTTVGNSFNPSGLSALTSFSFPALTTVGGNFSPSTMAALTSLSVPVIERIGTTLTSGSVISITSSTSALSTFQLPSTLKQVGNGGGNVVITSAALNQASVDSILVRLAALDGTNGTTLFSTRTVTITGTSSAPSATGLAAKATLVARGCTVTTN